MNVYVSLAALPSRESVTRKTLESLLRQSRPPYKIVVHLCPYYTRLKQSLHSDYLADFRNHPKVSFNMVNDDGPATKYLSAKALTSDCEDILVFCDDDVIYPTDSLERFVQFLNVHRRAAVGYLGRMLAKSLCFNEGIRVFDRPVRKDFSIQVDVLMATGMVAIRAGDFLNDLRWRWEEALTEGPRESIYLTDDIFLNAVLNVAGIKRYAIPGWVDCQRLAVPDALWALNRNGRNNDRALSYFKSAFLPVASGPLKRFWLKQYQALY